MKRSRLAQPFEVPACMATVYASSALAPSPDFQDTHSCACVTLRDYLRISAEYT